MGYEIKILIGKARQSTQEIERDLSKPFEDGSGFEYKRDESGEFIRTGRDQIYFSIMAMVDVCRADYYGAVYALAKKSHEIAKSLKEKQVVEFYLGDGDKELTEDRYGDPFYPIPIKEVCAAIDQDMIADPDYRRFVWAKALLDSMKDDTEDLEVLFFGY